MDIKLKSYLSSIPFRNKPFFNKTPAFASFNIVLNMKAWLNVCTRAAVA